jgi:hypothetical protein
MRFERYKDLQYSVGRTFCWEYEFKNMEAEELIEQALFDLTCPPQTPAHASAHDEVSNLVPPKNGFVVEEGLPARCNGFVGGYELPRPARHNV